MNQDFLLSSAGLSNVANSVLPDDFTFFVGKDKYKCNNLFADFISKKVAEIHCHDPLTDTYVVDVDDKFKTFELFIKLMHGEEVLVDPSQRKYIRKIAKELGNDELVEKFTYAKPGVELTPQNAVPILEERYENMQDYSAEIEYIAENFHAFDITEFRGVYYELLEAIFSHPKLLLKNEEDFIKIIIDLTLNFDHEYYKLFRFVNFQNCPHELMPKVLSLIRPEELSIETLDSLKVRLAQELKNVPPSDRYVATIHPCHFNGSDHFTGIFQFLYRLAGKNPAVASLIEMRAKGECNAQNASALLDREMRSNWGLYESVDNYLLIDFKQYTVQIDGYAFRGASNAHWDNPQSWTLEGSNDSTRWTVIDTKRRDTSMGGNDRQHYWQCRLSPPFRYIRWRLTQSGGGGLYCRQFELFGLIREEKRSRRPPVTLARF